MLFYAAGWGWEPVAGQVLWCAVTSELAIVRFLAAPHCSLD
jgi:hypothetical protein